MPLPTSTAVQCFLDCNGNFLHLELQDGSSYAASTERSDCGGKVILLLCVMLQVLWTVLRAVAV